MKKVLIICAAGMSSSMIAKKTTDFFASKNLPIEVDATTVSHASSTIARNEFDMYLLSPQAKMNHDVLSKAVAKVDKPFENIPPQAYVPTEAGITNIAKLIFTELKPSMQGEKQ